VSKRADSARGSRGGLSCGYLSSGGYEVLGDVRDRSRLASCAEALRNIGQQLMAASTDSMTLECDRDELVKAAVFSVWIESSIQVAIAAASHAWTPVAVLAVRRVPVVPRPEFASPLIGVVPGIARVRRMLVCAVEAVSDCESDTGIAICAALQQLSVWAHN